MCVYLSRLKIYKEEIIMGLIDNMERLELIETVQQYGFAKGAERNRGQSFYFL